MINGCEDHTYERYRENPALVVGQESNGGVDEPNSRRRDYTTNDEVAIRDALRADAVTEPLGQSLQWGQISETET